MNVDSQSPLPMSHCTLPHSSLHYASFPINLSSIPHCIVLNSPLHNAPLPIALCSIAHYSMLHCPMGHFPLTKDPFTIVQLHNTSISIAQCTILHCTMFNSPLTNTLFPIAPYPTLKFMLFLSRSRVIGYYVYSASV